LLLISLSNHWKGIPRIESTVLFGLAGWLERVHGTDIGDDVRATGGLDWFSLRSFGSCWFGNGLLESLEIESVRSHSDNRAFFGSFCYRLCLLLSAAKMLLLRINPSSLS
jgi:hypothetical protein